MSALCGVTGCCIEVTHFHHTSAGIPNMIGSWVKAATSGGGAVLHERQLYVYPRGPGDAPGNQWVCSCGRIWPCALITHDTIACSCHADCACASCVEDAEPTQEQKYEEVGMALAASLLRGAALREEVETLKGEIELFEERGERDRAELSRERAENERLSQCLAYERDEYGQYREAHPHSAKAEEEK
jgi:hypothetical protein